MSDHPIVKRPLVARAGSRLPALLGGAAALALGVGVFVGLDARRAAHAEGLAQSTEPVMLPTPQPLPTGAPTMAAGPVTKVPAPQFSVNNTVPTGETAPLPPAAISAAALAAQADARQRLAAPSLIVDFGTSESSGAAAGVPVRLAQINPSLPGAAAAGAAAGAVAGAQAAGQGVSRGVEEDAFSRRVAGERTDRVSAERMGALDETVPQGAIIDAVLETALDSDLPGYARAQVARDVLSFDGQNVLIPRGSRVIGQYKAANALGASRVFVIWSRIIRPDGVSIMLASPATDELGRAGLGGKVDRHFLQRFGGAILLSVLNGGIAAGTAAATSGSGVYISSVSDATSAATSALKGSDIPPTIRTPQGASVRIFVARDLDFTQVGPAR